MFPEVNSDSDDLPDNTIPWFVGDISASSFVPNPVICPRLAEIKREYESSNAYQEWLHSKENVEINKKLQGVFGSYDPAGLFDCLLTARFVLLVTVYNVKRLTVVL